MPAFGHVYPSLPLERELVRRGERVVYFDDSEFQSVVEASGTGVGAAAGLGFGGCRLFGDGQRVIERFAFLVGGFGENQWHMPQAAVEMGAEALLIGEMSEFILVAALELGVPVVETLHSVSEAPAIRRQAELLAARLPGVPVRYVESGALAFGRA